MLKMRHAKFALLLCGFFVFGFGAVAPVFASPLDCETIQDADHRNMCRALAKDDKTYCSFIHNKDMRYECRARTSN